MLTRRAISWAAASAAAVAVLAGCAGDASQRSAGGILSIEVPAAPGATRGPETASGRMAVGERLEVRLGAYAGTGYAWSLAGPVPPNMQLTTADPAGASAPAPGTSAGEQRVGGATVTTFGMAAIAAGESHLRFVLARPWEASAPARTVDVSVRVAPAGQGGR